VLSKEADLVLKAHGDHKGKPYYAKDLVQPRGPLTLDQISNAYQELARGGKLQGTDSLVNLVPSDKAPHQTRVATKYILP
jgi:hypothetical protein